MNKKKIFVLGIALLLFALIAGVAFAGSLRGVQWMITDDGITVTNGNDYRVRVSLNGDSGFTYKYLDAYETKFFPGSWDEVSRVVKD